MISKKASPVANYSGLSDFHGNFGVKHFCPKCGEVYESGKGFFSFLSLFCYLQFNLINT